MRHARRRRNGTIRPASLSRGNFLSLSPSSEDMTLSFPSQSIQWTYAGKDGSFLARDGMQDAVVTGAGDVGTSEGAGLGVELDERESLEGAGIEFEGVAVVDLPERESRQSTG
jgi:hypothetical protein